MVLQGELIWQATNKTIRTDFPGIMSCRKAILIRINVMVRCSGKDTSGDILLIILNYYVFMSCQLWNSEVERGISSTKDNHTIKQATRHSTLSSWQHLNDLKRISCGHVHCINMLTRVWDYDNMDVGKSFWDPSLGPHIVDLIIFVSMIVTFSQLSLAPCHAGVVLWLDQGIFSTVWKKEKAAATSQCWMSLTEGVIGVLSLMRGFLFLFFVIQSSKLPAHDQPWLQALVDHTLWACSVDFVGHLNHLTTFEYCMCRGSRNDKAMQYLRYLHFKQEPNERRASTLLIAKVQTTSAPFQKGQKKVNVWKAGCIKLWIYVFSSYHVRGISFFQFC